VKWAEEYEEWRKRPLASHYAYIWTDGVYIKVGRNKTKLALLVVMGADVMTASDSETMVQQTGGHDLTSFW
jgi:hypothetical protein